MAFSVLATAIVLALTAACEGSSDPGASAQPTPTPDAYRDLTVIQPGRPGEPASTGVPAPTESQPPSHSDIAFMQMMVPHHAQALEMCRLARSRAADPLVRRMAARTRAAQGPEILTMSAWLEQQGVAVPQPGDDPGEWDHAEHGHDAMRGMISAAQLRDLAAARGPAFDRLFLRGMIRHHEGAVAMAKTVSANGTDQRVAALAADVYVTQAVEIGRMRELLDRL